MTLISRVGPDEYDAAGTDGVAPPGQLPAEPPADTGGETVSEAVRRVTAEAAHEDGRSPLNEAALLSLGRDGLAGKELWVARDEAGTVVGFALAALPGDSASDPSEGAGPVEVNLVVSPASRRAGIGRALAEEVLAAFADRPVTAWSHGNHPAAERLAAALGLDRVRDLWVMRRPLGDDTPLPPVQEVGGIVVRTFRVGEDEDALLAVNAEAFAGHPEQGGLSREDLDERIRQPWFDAEGLFLAEPADAPHNEANDIVDSPSLLGFHWTKVHEADPPHGEVYVVGIAPAAQGRGLGRLLTLTGLHHLAERGLSEVILYVEADNAPAVAMYSNLGFTHADEDTDVMYARG